jgi:hypothetical protein
MTVEEMRHARAGGPAHDHRLTGQIRLGHGGEYAILFVPHMDQLDLPVAAQGIDDRIEGITDDAVTACHAGLCEHCPHDVGNGARHDDSPRLGAVSWAIP